MRRRIWPGWFILVLYLLWLPAVAFADDGEAAEAPEEAVSEEEEAISEDEESAEEEEISEEEATSEEEAATLDEDGVVDDDEADLDSEDDLSVDDEADEDGEPALGPGGRELTTDYPGTEESLQPRMDTSRIEGITIPEGEDPEEVYDLRVRELETQIDDLKERVFRSKSRIALLRETVLAENLAGSRAIVTFTNNLGSRYNVERAIFSVDGGQVHSEVGSDGKVGSGDPVEVFTGAMAPGTHTVSVILGLRGSGYGVFSYAEGYTFDLRFSCQFTAEEGRTTLVNVESYKSGNVFSAHEDRPDGICSVSMVDLTVDDIEDEDVPQLD